MSKTMIHFSYIIGQYKEVTDHLFIMVAMRTRQRKEINHRVIQTDFLKGL